MHLNSRNYWLLAGFAFILAAFGTYLALEYRSAGSQSVTKPFFEALQPEAPKPLLKYAISQLASYPVVPSTIEIIKEQAQTPAYRSYVFRYTTMGKTMSGQLNIPEQFLIPTASSEAQLGQDASVIVLIRGYVPPEIFESGVGTKNAAKVFAENGYITLAPDFLGFGQSDPEPADPWEARFIKPVNVLELIASLRTNGVPLPQNDTVSTTHLTVKHLGMWAHSNGGQIALTTLEALSQSIPTTLWAPVTAPFPYSILFFGDEEDDEGKAQRAWIAQFEKVYDPFDFSLTKHLDQLTGPIQIHHGTNDDAALYSWSTEFVDKVERENERRAERATPPEATTSSTTPMPSALPAIDVQLITHPGADHNLQPAQHWNDAIQKDLTFFTDSFGQ